ncbi:hypothetical protein C8R45DRAFT_1022967 [Mycena sanguinolenta]|nr:hypothetical protein C8R45DRAFT_1022967 [Mycena sanguinolenta]
MQHRFCSRSATERARHKPRSQHRPQDLFIAVLGYVLHHCYSRHPRLPHDIKSTSWTTNLISHRFADTATCRYERTNVFGITQISTFTLRKTSLVQQDTLRQSPPVSFFGSLIRSSQDSSTHARAADVGSSCFGDVNVWIYCHVPPHRLLHVRFHTQHPSTRRPTAVCLPPGAARVRRTP